MRKRDKRMKEQIEKFLEVLPYISKEQADDILEIVNWDAETRAAYKLAKRIFDEDGDPSEYGLEEA